MPRIAPNTPTKITIEMNGKKYSIEVGHSDLLAEDFVALIREMMLAIGYHPDTVDKYLPE